MAKKVNKNQRTDRHKNRIDRKMAKVMIAEKKPNGQYSFRTRVVELDAVQAELNAVRG